MSDAFLNALKWYVLVFCAIVGASAFIIADETNSVKPIMLGVLGFGVVYIMSYFWTEFRGKLLFSSMMVFLCISFIAPWFWDMLYVIFAWDVDGKLDPYQTWAMVMALFGIPIMTAVFYFLDG